MKMLNGQKYRQSCKLTLKNCGHSMKWKELAVNRMLLVTIKRRANTFFVIVQRKVLTAAEMFVTTVKGKRKGKKKDCIQEVTSLIWQPPWASSL